MEKERKRGKRGSEKSAIWRRTMVSYFRAIESDYRLGRALAQHKSFAGYFA